MADYLVYVLANLDNNRTYVGCTNNPDRRIRQHNQVIQGGAKATKCSRTWRYMVQVRGFTTRSDALSFEWHCKRKKRTKGKSPIARRCHILTVLFTEPRWTTLYITHCDPEVLSLSVTTTTTTITPPVL